MKSKPSLVFALLSVWLAAACSSNDEPSHGGTGGTAVAGGAASGATSGTSPAPSGSSGASASGGSAFGGSGAGVSSGGSSGTGSAGISSGGGNANGGQAGSGGVAGSSAGSGGSEGGNLVESVTGLENANGFALNDSFYLVPCLQVDGHDCLTVIGACPNQSAASFEERGAIFKEDFTIGGEVGKTYKVTIQVNGITEGKYYSGGTRRDGTSYSSANAATGGDGWHVGGTPVTSNYNVFKLSVLKPGGTEELQHYYLNSFPAASGFESHQTVLLGYEATFEVPGGGIVRYLRVDSNCKAINNCGPGDNGDKCPNPRKLPNEPDLALPAMYGGQSVASMNVVNGAAQPYHSQLVHVTVKKVELIP